ncbi:MAG: hypothetical protein LBD75_06355 [Candidatus Peribacteria bacterium]|jgi:hypothetical protein|nr:hypothetical protein [Candidatus Peribacteria bacterium]
MSTSAFLSALSPTDQVGNLINKGVIFTDNDKKEAQLFFKKHSHFKVNYHRQSFQKKR